VIDGRSYKLQSQGFFVTGHKPVLSLRTREGHRLRLTADHRVRRVARKTRHSLELDWIEAGQLQPGDEIVLTTTARWAAGRVRAPRRKAI
jgi:ribonucleoside-diphosphate reductase alpha chain